VRVSWCPRDTLGLFGQFRYRDYEIAQRNSASCSDHITRTSPPVAIRRHMNSLERVRVELRRPFASQPVLYKEQSKGRAWIS